MILSSAIAPWCDNTHMKTLHAVALLGALLSGCGGPPHPDLVTVRAEHLALEVRFLKVDGVADCAPGPYPVTYRWGGSALVGCFTIPAQCFVGEPTYEVDLLGIDPNGIVVQYGRGTIAGTTAQVRPPAGPVQTVSVSMQPRTPVVPLTGWTPNPAWPELVPCR